MMTPASPTPVSRPNAEASWQQAFREAVRDAALLCRLLELPDALATAAQAGAQDFPVFAPLGFIARMRKGDPADPLLRQVLPLADEAVAATGFTADPVGDRAAQRLPGLLHKYHGRALMVTTGACAVHCRYCFRRHFPYSDSPRSLEAWQPALEVIAADPSLEEVILSGGDPLTLVDSTLAALVERLGQIPHLRRLRIHTRLPIMIPQRVTDELLDWLTGTALTPIMVLHANHAAELDESVRRSVLRMAERGIVLLNQAVLLRGINDSAQALIDLSERLLELRVLPYYLHQLDRVAGGAHFEVPREEGRLLMATLKERLPGYAVPRYVEEVPGAAHKLDL